MESMSRTFATHPNFDHVPPEVQTMVQELIACEAACTVCADACLAEQEVQMLANCIAVDLNCADVCGVTARLAERMAHHSRAVMPHMIEACREICRLCAEECERHEHEHCRACAEACRRCERACDAVLRRAMAAT